MKTCILLNDVFPCILFKTGHTCILVKEQCSFKTGLLAHHTQYSMRYEIRDMLNWQTILYKIWDMLIANNTLRYDGRADYKRIAPRGNGSEERGTAAINSKTGSGQQSSAKQVKHWSRWNGQKEKKRWLEWWSCGWERGKPLDRVPGSSTIYIAGHCNNWKWAQQSVPNRMGSSCARMRMFRKARRVISPTNWVDNTGLVGGHPDRRMPYCSGQMEGCDCWTTDLWDTPCCYVGIHQSWDTACCCCVGLQEKKLLGVNKKDKKWS